MNHQCDSVGTTSSPVSSKSDERTKYWDFTCLGNCMPSYVLDCWNMGEHDEKEYHDDVTTAIPAYYPNSEEAERLLFLSSPPHCRRDSHRAISISPRQQLAPLKNHHTLLTCETHKVKDPLQMSSEATAARNTENGNALQQSHEETPSSVSDEETVIHELIAGASSQRSAAATESPSKKRKGGGGNVWGKIATKFRNARGKTLN